MEKNKVKEVERKFLIELIEQLYPADHTEKKYSKIGLRLLLKAIALTIAAEWRKTDIAILRKYCELSIKEEKKNKLRESKGIKKNQTEITMKKVELDNIKTIIFIDEDFIFHLPEMREQYEDKTIIGRIRKAEIQCDQVSSKKTPCCHECQRKETGESIRLLFRCDYKNLSYRADLPFCSASLEKVINMLQEMKKIGQLPFAPEGEAS